ncbi:MULTISPECIES: hypothetical protein [Sphingomonas]|uniref:hypothetical protein n=1 Tax=Sphingomonas TaxID=13687 RepID=UPI000F7DBBAC|nr:hypothetical protein [Sphingomonas sp. ABOLF]RSV14628.1 hypothetical protein CA235_11150 [Sphingomonas sp. ABOLF]GLK19229.1 hypothetical protein GCM10017606_00550 [Microbacterium terregens]
MRFVAAPLALSFILAACGSSPTPTATDEADTGDITNLMSDPFASGSTPAATVAATTPYAIEACKAAVAALNGRDPATMKGKKLTDDLVHVSYIRPDDGKRWQSRCRIDDANHLTWAQFDAFGDGQQGRWRTEDTVGFSVEGKNLHVKVSTEGELMSDETYPLSKLKG